MNEVKRLRTENLLLRKQILELQTANAQFVTQVSELQTANAQFVTQVSEAQQAIEKLQGQVTSLTSQLQQDSRNSHWPPSRDKQRKKRRTKSQRRKSNKAAGGQQGHAGKTLEFSAEPDEVISHRPECCRHCQEPFDPAQAAEGVNKRQVHDLPPLRLIVTEHQSESLRCRHCQQLSAGNFPETVTARAQYGSGVRQLALYLKIQQLIPYDRSRQFFADLFDANLSTGTLQNIVNQAAATLEPTLEEIKEALRDGELLHCDESGFYINGKRHWLHVASNEYLTYYLAHPKRGREAIEALAILPYFQGTTIHDFWASYQPYDRCKHGLCNTHHLRDLIAIGEAGPFQVWAFRFHSFLLRIKAIVDHQRALGATAFAPEKLQQLNRLYDRLVSAALAANPPPPDGWPKGKRGRAKKSKARNLAERFERHRSQVLAFAYDFKVPFDNNLAERDIRMLKVQQKISGCFRSQEGADAFCAIRSYLSSMRKHSYSVWDALASVVNGHPVSPLSLPV